ncbi:sugar isomerase [candidate division KSB1 bacterium]
MSRNHLSRRNFLKITGLGSAGAFGTVSSSGTASEAERTAGAAMTHLGAPLTVQPALIYKLNRRSEATSWRKWGGLQTQGDVDKEAGIIRRELDQMTAAADFPIKFLPLALVSTPDEGAAARKIDCDVQLAYWSPGEYENSRYDAYIDPSKPNLMFVRDESGYHYGGYLHAQSHWLRKRTDGFQQEGMDVWDIVVDDYGEMLWRLRGLYGLNTMVGSKIVAVGGAAGWGPVASQVGPDRARSTFKLEIPEVGYDELGKMLKPEISNPTTLREAEGQTQKILNEKGVSLHTDRAFLVNSFVLEKVFRRLMDEHNSPAMTINECMTTIMPLSKTTACMALSGINDSGLLAYCESDFAVVPACMLLRYVSGRPVFFANPSIPNNGVTTIAHCMAPRKMDGLNPEPTKILTHFESDYGTAPKVSLRKGQTVTVIAPNFQATKWIGFRGKVIKNPAHPICRTQVKVAIDGDWRTLRENVQGFHWALCYGDYLKEIGYALKRTDIKWECLSEERTA